MDMSATSRYTLPCHEEVSSIHELLHRDGYPQPHPTLPTHPMTEPRDPAMSKGGRGKLIGLTGQPFGQLVVLRQATPEEIRQEKYPNHPDSPWLRKCLSAARWLCRCTCGQEKSVLGTNLRGGKTRSCGNCAPEHQVKAKAVPPVTPRRIIPRAPLTHCPRGHAYDSLNTRISRSSGAKVCRACDADRSRSRKRANQEQQAAISSPPQATPRTKPELGRYPSHPPDLISANPDCSSLPDQSRPTASGLTEDPPSPPAAFAELSSQRKITSFQVEYEVSTNRIVVWFSCGAASAVAAKLTLAKYRQTHEVLIVRIAVADEHPDSDRFAADCVRWFNSPIHTIRSTEYKDCSAVFDDKRYMSGISGATCTGQLKKAPRHAFQLADDIQVFGYTVDERRRAERFRKENFDVILETPLIDAGLNKDDCHALIERAGIKRHAMYDMGFPNANCRGCVKATGPGYWNLTRQWFPDYFASRAVQSRELGCRLVRLNGRRIFLDELPEGVGNVADEPNFDCSLLCHMAEQDFAA